MTFSFKLSTFSLLLHKIQNFSSVGHCQFFAWLQNSKNSITKNSCWKYFENEWHRFLLKNGWPRPYKWLQFIICEKLLRFFPSRPFWLTEWAWDCAWVCVTELGNYIFSSLINILCCMHIAHRAMWSGCDCVKPLYSWCIGRKYPIFYQNNIEYSTDSFLIH